MFRQIFIILFLAAGTVSGQQVSSRTVGVHTVDDRNGGYVLYSYKIPEDGEYTFTLDGGLLSRTDCTVYYYEYLLVLESQRKSYMQEKYNIGSQAQDGNVCYFHTNEKDNRISGTFMKDEVVQLRLVLLKSDVNGVPHHKLQLARNTVVSIEKAGTVVTASGLTR